MKAYKVEMLVIDFDNLGSDGIKSMIENTQYPNHWCGPEVKSIVGKDIGPWGDEQPLNSPETCDAEYKRLFGE